MRIHYASIVLVCVCVGCGGVDGIFTYLPMHTRPPISNDIVFYRGDDSICHCKRLLTCYIFTIPILTLDIHLKRQLRDISMVQAASFFAVINCAKAMEARTLDGKCQETTVNSMDVRRTMDGKC